MNKAIALFFFRNGTIVDEPHKLSSLYPTSLRSKSYTLAFAYKRRGLITNFTVVHCCATVVRLFFCLKTFIILNNDFEPLFLKIKHFLPCFKRRKNLHVHIFVRTIRDWICQDMARKLRCKRKILMKTLLSGSRLDVGKTCHFVFVFIWWRLFKVIMVSIFTLASYSSY